MKLPPAPGELQEQVPRNVVSGVTISGGVPRNNWMWHALVDKVMISPRLDLMILVIFSNLNNSMILH